MRDFVRNFYKKASSIEGIEDPFHENLFLSFDSNFTFNELKAKAPIFPRSWFELIHLPPREKIDFVLENWIDTLSPSFELSRRLESFFSLLDDIGIFLVKDFPSSPYRAEMVYSLENKNLFFVGSPPLSFSLKDSQSMGREGTRFDERQGSEILSNENDSISVNDLSDLNYGGQNDLQAGPIDNDVLNLLPEDYLSFFRIHNGFRRFDDRGIIKLEELQQSLERFQKCYLECMDKVPLGEEAYDPKGFIPIYRDNFGGSICFYQSSSADRFFRKIFYVDKRCLLKKDPVTNFDKSFFSFTSWLCYYLDGK